MKNVFLLALWAVTGSAYMPGDEYSVSHNVTPEIIRDAEIARAQVKSSSSAPEVHPTRVNVIHLDPCASKLILKEDGKIIHQVDLPTNKERCEGIDRNRQSGSHTADLNQLDRAGKDIVNPHQGNQIIQPVPVQPGFANPVHAPVNFQQPFIYQSPGIQQPQFYRPPAPVYEDVHQSFQPYPIQPFYQPYSLIEDGFQAIPQGFIPGQTPCHTSYSHNPLSRSAYAEMPSVPLPYVL